MPDNLHSTVGEFSSAGGRWQPRAVNVRAVEPAPDLPAAQRGNLYMYVEVTGGEGGHASLYRQLLNAAQTAFYEQGETVDGALRQAVRNIHTILRQANTSIPGAPLRAGVTLVVRYANQLVIGQAGPSLCLVGHPKTIDQYPATYGKWTPALGGDERPEVMIFDSTIEAGSMVVLAQSTWPQHAPLEHLVYVPAADTVTLASEYMRTLAREAELSALLIRFDSSIPEVRLDQNGAVVPRSGGREESGSEPARPAPRGLFGGRRLLGFGRGEEKRDEDPNAFTDARPDLSGEVSVPVETTLPPPPHSAPVVPPAYQPTPMRPASHAEFQEPAAPMAPRGEEWSSPQERHTVKTVPAFQPAVASPLTSAEEIEWPATGPAPARTQRRSAWPLVLGLVVLPLLIIGVVVSMLLVRTRAAEAQFVEKLDGAAKVISQAETAPSDNIASERLTEARDFLEEARGLRPNDPRLDEQQTRFEAVLNRVERITPLYGIVPLWDFKSEGRALSRVVASGDSLFVLDRGRNEVHRFTRSTLGDSVTPASEDAQPLFVKGQQLGDVAVADLIDMAWGPAATANQRSLLMALDSAKNVVGFDTVYGAKALAVGSKDKWMEPQLLTGYEGRLYVADVAADQIWRYAPSTNGFEGEGEAYFQNPNDLAGLQAMAIDGNVWLLFADGRLLKFFGGQQTQFAVQGVPGGFSAPTTLAVPQEGSRMYVADPLNSRIVELTKDGQFIRQFKAREGDILKNMKHLFLDEAGGMFYILTGDQLFKAIVPDPASAPEPTRTSEVAS